MLSHVRSSGPSAERIISILFWPSLNVGHAGRDPTHPQEFCSSFVRQTEQSHICREGSAIARACGRPSEPILLEREFQQSSFSGFGLWARVTLWQSIVRPFWMTIHRSAGSEVPSSTALPVLSFASDHSVSLMLAWAHQPLAPSTVATFRVQRALC
ncbi:hypothetical protein EJ03DRAFT_60241 [Teratosphaeria nubilosa]|uniref:Uncharacterized protein n=1 Tax=Teratosphaeria nubilosa TaxID=161662 RepID=A0A6G1LCQ1_9PEZI|nr:hypothetical protein EJ03DRAFT_60241 [Teratosphaeria nubilosa]